MIADIFASLSRSPKTLGGLARELGSNHSAAEAALMQLARGGYIVKVPPRVESCSGGGCGACSMHNLCPSSDTSAESRGPGPELWQLTEKGRSRVVLRAAN